MVTTTIRIKNRGKVVLSSFDIIGIHTMEAPELPQTAENVARYFDSQQADAHWCTDCDSRVRVIEDQYVAWTMPGVNSRSRNIEIAGYARQTPEDWADAYSLAALEVTALCAAEWVIEGGIPIRHLTDEQIRAGQKGFAGHVDVNRVYKKSTHWDPGPAFPWDYFLGRVAAHVAQLRGSTQPGTVPVAQAPTPSWDNRGYSQEWIAAQQAKLIRLGYDLGADGADGKRGPKTIAATTAFQASHGLTVDGIPGPDTAKALDAALDVPAPLCRRSRATRTGRCASTRTASAARRRSPAGRRSWPPRSTVSSTVRTRRSSRPTSASSTGSSPQCTSGT
ncbi:peptidoglycan recognition protein family protein [Xylanimonas protaetiae]|uniref:Peptidoglycan-binding domain-containing protein n=1 Tax=Xylanimonas protaetiae TaxID=2509457 RepID=A0A4P6F3T4_9MICO|nr:peptidoglycan-binding domain-containing protein [Xylanimonas protaetiae]QAY69976.1 peptidoglycan-binding domain-containing protein [Xylanimonas protaetiae]